MDNKMESFSRSVCGHWALLAVVGQLLCTFRVDATAFIERPTSVNATLNSLVVFNCRTDPDGQSVFWQDGNGTKIVENDCINFTSLPMSGGGGIHGILTINSRMEYDNFIIVCVASDENGTSSSDPVLLRVQGLLDPPDTLMAMNTNSGAIKLSWTPPFTLDITDVDPDISSYTVYITNTNTSNTGTVSVTELDGNGVVETEYTFTGLPGEDPDPCHVYQFSVSAWNVVGKGDRSDPMEGYFVGGPLENFLTSIPEITVSFSNNKPEVDIVFQVNTSCLGLVPRTLRMIFHSNSSDEPMALVEDVPPSGRVVLRRSGEDLHINDVYYVEVTAENDMGRSSPPINVTFTTYDVQDVKVKEIKGAVSVTCFFAAGSQAQGCRVIFKSNCSISDDPDINRKGDESEVEQVFSLPNGTYEIAIYDIEADGTQSEYPAYELDKQIVVQDSMSECEDEGSDTGKSTVSSALISYIVGVIVVVVTSYYRCFVY